MVLPRLRSPSRIWMMNSFTQELLSTVVFILLLGPTTTNGQQFFFCRSLENNTWAGFVDAIQDSYRLAVLCPFVIEGSGCPREDEYPEGLALTSGMIIECDPDLNDRFDEHANTKCVIDCPGRHFTVYPSSPGLILTNMVLSGATNTSIYVKPEATLEVVNIHFNNNSAGDSMRGGAISAMDRSEVLVEFSTFTDNTARLGGAIFSQGDLDVRQCNLDGNSANIAGGAVLLDAGSQTSISDSTLTNNDSFDGGAIYVGDFASLALNKSEMTGNVASRGGSIFNGGATDIQETFFLENWGALSGGAIHVEVGSSTEVTKSSFVENGSSGVGPALYDKFNMEIPSAENTGCGNRVVRGGVLLGNRVLQCDGQLKVLGRRRVRCQPFEDVCERYSSAPSSAPSSVPTDSRPPSEMPSSLPLPSTSPSSSPTYVPSTTPSAPPTDSPSLYPSSIPSDQPSLVPSQRPSTSQIPSDMPSLLPSLTPTTSIGENRLIR